MKRSPRLLVPVLAVLALSVTGCVSSRYKRMAPVDSVPATTLNLSSSAAAAAPESAPSPSAVSVQNVIIYRGPGSWKRDAYWDEYVVSLHNPGPTPLTIESAVLTDFQNQTATPGTAPWSIESESRTWQARAATAGGTAVKIGAGVVTTTVVGVATGASIVGGGGYAAMGGAIIGGLVAVPVFAGVTLYANVSARHEIEREFQRRRLALPATVLPGQTTQGSLFFRISPGPRQIKFHLVTDAGPRDETIDLSALHGLHLSSPPTPAPTGANPTAGNVRRPNTPGP